jgi:hypothetical protein
MLAQCMLDPCAGAQLKHAIMLIDDFTAPYYIVVSFVAA